MPSSSHISRSIHSAAGQKGAIDSISGLSRSNRVRIVNLLATSADPVCVCDLTPVLDLSQPTVSFHLKKLLTAGLVQREQRGKWAYYSMRPGALAELAAVLQPRGAST